MLCWTLVLLLSPSFSAAFQPLFYSSFKPPSFLKMSAKVLIVGSANQDLTTYTSRVPRMGETVLGQDFKMYCGGKGANQAVAASALTKVEMVCKVGNDLYGDNLLGNFDQAGVQYDADTVKCHDAPTGVAPIVVDTTTGDNSIIVVPGANHKLTPEEVRQVIVNKKPKVVLTQLEVLPEAALAAMEAGKQVGAITILNPAPAPNTLLQQFFKCVDILIPNETELALLYQGVAGDKKDSEVEMAKALLAQGIAVAVVVTLGARGAVVVRHDDQVTYVSSPPGLPCEQDPVVDTVGAGDSFCGSLAAYLSSSSVELEEAAGKACGIASMAVRKYGAQSSYPTADELPESLKLTAPATRKV